MEPMKHLSPAISPPTFDHVSWFDLIQRYDPGLLHNQLKLDAQYVQHLLHARLPERPQAPQVRPSDANRFCAERQRLEDVRSASKAPVDKHRDTASDSVDHFRQAL